MMDTLVTDPIPNIRFNIAKSYGVLINVLKRLPAQGSLIDLEKSQGKDATSGGSQSCLEVVHSKILPNLEKLCQDEDVDVRYFATVAAAKARHSPGDGDEMMVET